MVGSVVETGETLTADKYLAEVFASKEHPDSFNH